MITDLITSDDDDAGVHHAPTPPMPVAQTHTHPDPKLQKEEPEDPVAATVFKASIITAQAKAILREARAQAEEA